MSEYKVGDKVLVEARVVRKEKRIGEYQIKINSYTDDSWVEKEKIYPLTAKDTNIPTKTYEDGLNEAWELAKKLFLYPHEGGYNSTELEEIFGRTEHLWKLSPQEAAAKIAEWESRQDIHVGDLVRVGFGYGVVTSVHKENCYVLWTDGSSGCRDKKYLTKTGRTIDIAWLLAQIGGAE